MKDHGWVYEDEGVWVYRASVFGSCLRSLVSARCGESAFPFNASIQAAMDASSGLEDVILNRIIAELGGELIWQQKEVELKVAASVESGDRIDNQVVVIRGHIDALRQDDDTIIEAKALGPANFAKYNKNGLSALGKLGDKYRWQGSVYGHATGRRVRFVIGEKVETKNEDGSSTWGINQLIIEPAVEAESLVPLQEICDRVRLIEDFASRDFLPDCDQKCTEWDPYSESHLFPSPEEGSEELLVKLTRYSELREMLGDADKGTGLLGELEDIKEYIKQEYGDARETKKITAGPFSVSVVAQKGREYIDRKWLQKNHPDIADAATRIGTPFMQVVVKKR